MPESPVRLHVLSAGFMTSALGTFLEGEGGDLTFPVLVFVIEHPDGLAMVDAGLHPDLATNLTRMRKMAGRFEIHLPADGSGSVGPALRSAGFDPARVDRTVLTHLHFDHTGGLVELPNSRIVVQAREWADRHHDRLVASGAYNPDDVELGHDVVEIDGDHDLFGDGTVTCLLTDGHTAGHQSIRVHADSGTYLICGDCCYLRRTLVDEHLPPFARDRERQLASVRRVAAEQAAGATPIFGHDPDQWALIESEGLRHGV